MSYRLVPYSVTLTDLERCNSYNLCVISPNSVAFWALFVKVVEDTPILLMNILIHFGVGGRESEKSTLCTVWIISTVVINLLLLLLLRVSRLRIRLPELRRN